MLEIVLFFRHTKSPQRGQETLGNQPYDWIVPGPAVGCCIHEVLHRKLTKVPSDVNKKTAK